MFRGFWKGRSDMQIVTMMKRGSRYLLARVVDEDAMADNYIKSHFKIGEVYEYVVCANYNGKEWDCGDYYGYRYLQSAIDAFNKGHSITYARLSELATLFKDGLIEDDEENAMEYFLGECDMVDDELDYFGIEYEKEEEPELEYDMSKVDEYFYGIR